MKECQCKTCKKLFERNEVKLLLNDRYICSKCDYKNIDTGRQITMKLWKPYRVGYDGSCAVYGEVDENFKGGGY